MHEGTITVAMSGVPRPCYTGPLAADSVSMAVTRPPAAASPCVCPYIVGHLQFVQMVSMAAADGKRTSLQSCAAGSTMTAAGSS